MFAKVNLDPIKKQIGNIVEDIKVGARKADAVQAGATGRYTRDPRGGQYKPGASTTGPGLGYGQSIFDPRFKESMKAQGVSLRETPAQFLGAYLSRTLVDLGNDGTRTYWWRYNAPPAVGQAVLERGINQKLIKSPTGRALVGLSVGVPALAVSGTYDITNPEEQFRPKGFAQRYSALGSEDRRQTTDPTGEMFERFFLNRTGDPLKYETAKQDIPSLTPERYGNYMNFLYQDKGLLNLGIKATAENLQGYPEARMLGFPVTLPQVGAYGVGAAGAVAGAKLAQNASKRPVAKTIGGVAGGLAGALTGIAVGNISNELIARANRPTYLSTVAYDQNVS